MRFLKRAFDHSLHGSDCFYPEKHALFLRLYGKKAHSLQVVEPMPRHALRLPDKKKQSRIGAIRDCRRSYFINTILRMVV
jgi:hypothetical protein